jgi:hypothetical protein
MLITASAVPNAYSRDALWNFGLLVGLIGILGWAVSIALPPPKHKP